MPGEKLLMPLSSMLPLVSPRASFLASLEKSAVYLAHMQASHPRPALKTALRITQGPPPLTKPVLWASQVALAVKNPPATAGRGKRWGFDPWAGKIPWRRAWQSSPIFLPGESHGQEPGGL